MRSWVLKAAVQGVLSLLPEPQRWNRMLQKTVTRSLDLTDDDFLAKWRHAEGHIIAMRETRSVEQPLVLEIGTGWFPIVPIALSLAGARVVTVDQESLLRVTNVLRTIDRFVQALGSEEIAAPRSDAADRLHRVKALAPGRSVADLLRLLDIEAVVGDVGRLALGADSLDLICSNNTLEHIPRPALVAMFERFRRLAKPNAIMSHHIDMSDHYAHFDPSITVYNFLRFSDRLWPLFNNKLQYQNRLRLSDFRVLLNEAGWVIVSEKNQSYPLDVLRSVPIAERFQAYHEADLAVHNSWITCRASAV